ncbi:MAG: glycosyltransferase family 4 protein [Bacteroidaceae bacterium]|nr:glycosyltransferase family 4 protein [Bacteroidaceae bacterium]
MRIGFDAKRLFNNFTGLGNHSRTTVDILTEYYPKNEFLLYTPKIKHNAVTDQYIDHTSCRIIQPHGLLRGSAWRTFGLAKAARNESVDIFHGLSNELPVGLEIPSVVTIHDVAFKTFPDMYHAIDRFTYDRKWRHACRTANRIIAISESTKQDIIRFYGVEPDRIDIVYQPVNSIYYTNEKGVCPVSLEPYVNGKPYMLYVGSINSRKNLLGIVKTIELLPKEIQIPLIVIGDGREYKQKVSDYIAEHKLQNLIIFSPEKVGTEGLRYLYSNARMLVYPSFYEGFGLPVVEALLSHCPVVTSNVSSLPEAAGPDSLLADPSDIRDIADKMKVLLTDDALRESIIEKGYRYGMDSFSPKVLADRLMSIYKQLV